MISTAERLERVIDRTRQAVEQGSREIREIVSDTRLRIHQLTDELMEIKARLAHVIVEVDELEDATRSARDMIASLGRRTASDDDFRGMMTRLKALTDEVIVVRRREADLGARRNEIERYLKDTGELLVKSESAYGKTMRALTQLDAAEFPKDADDFTLRLVEAQDIEKKRLARDMHDGAAQSLVNVILKAEYAERMADQPSLQLKQELREIQGAVRTVLAEIRKIIFDLMPYTLEQHGLAKTLPSYLAGERAVRIEADIVENARIRNHTVEVHLFRIVQEIVSNIVKHAKCRAASLRLRVEEDEIRLCVEDRGAGFDPDAADGPEGFGLCSIRDRARLIGARLSIESAVGRGTKIEIEVKNK